MKQGERKKSWNNAFIYTLAIFVVLFSMPNFVFAKETKPAPIKTFFAKFIKKKPSKNKQETDSPQEENVTLIKGSITLSIDDCVNYALKNDPNIKNYEATQKAQKSAVGIAKSSYFPSLYGGTGYTISNTKYFGDLSNSVNNNYYGLNAGINQLIWDFGYTTAKINMNKYNWEASGYDVETSILNSIYTVKIAYTAVLAARANEDIYARSVRINELNVDRTRAMYEVGLKSKIDLVNAEATLTNAQIKLIDAQNQYQTALITLNNSMYYVNAPDYSIKDTETFNFQKNYSVKNEIDVAYDRKNYDESSIDAELRDGAILTSGIEKRDIIKSYTFKPFGYTMTEAIAKAYENRPDLKSLMLVRRASEESLKVIKRSYYPALNASAGYTFAKRSDYGSNAIGIYAGMDLPTINAMSIKNQINQGKAYLDIATNNIDLLKTNIYFQIQNYYVNMKKLEKTIPLMSKKVEQTLENFELADGRYAVGLSNYLELQQAQTDYNNAQLAFVQSVFDYNEARFYLEKAMGLR
ncbi:MAG: TolC family protein [Candidatus Gastranaerophilales bacterium]|nr:TolC family protein [Candidatus Gastranaerophilales bacterium]